MGREELRVARANEQVQNIIRKPVTPAPRPVIKLPPLPPVGSDEAKKLLKNLKKKIKSIMVIEEAIRNGKDVDPKQIEKYIKKEEFLLQVQALLKQAGIENGIIGNESVNEMLEKCQKEGSLLHIKSLKIA